MNKTPPKSIKTPSIQKHILNEFASKILNEEKLSSVMLERSRRNRLTYHSEMMFHCECTEKSCSEMIPVSAEEYAKVHMKTKQFIVTRAHIKPELEKVKHQFSNYTLVEKFFPA